MVKILIRIKNRLLTEALNFYLKKGLNQNYQVFTHADPDLDYDLILFDQTSLKEGRPEDFPLSKKILVDNGLMDQEILFLFIYYKLAGVFATDTNPELLPKCIEVVLKGEIWLSKNLMKGLCEDFNSFTKREIPALTQKEREIVKLICDGLSNREVAYRLSLSEQTVKCHLNRIFKKTGLKNRNQLIKMFYNTSIISGDLKESNGSNGVVAYHAGAISTSERPRKILKIKSKIGM